MLEETTTDIGVEPVDTAMTSGTDALDEPAAMLDITDEREPTVVEQLDEGGRAQEKAAKRGSFQLSLSETPRHLKSVL
jgi:hypothetical protein|eukprot:COSAG02_NODE_10869_length_1842_cov_1.609868_2_plen_78_part_00